MNQSRTIIRNACIGGLGVVLAVASTALAQTPASQPASPSREGADRRIVDARTGLELNTTLADGEWVARVGTTEGSIEKRVSAGRSVTTMRKGTSEVRLVAESGGLIIEDPAAASSSLRVTGETLDRVRTLITSSGAVTAARALLARLDLQHDAVAGQALLLTRVLLESLAGDGEVLRRYHDSVVQAARQPRVTTTAYGRSPGPGECWDEYAAYLLKIENDYLACYYSYSWYNIIGRDECAFVWGLQAELAMDWLIACTGGLPVK